MASLEEFYASIKDTINTIKPHTLMEMTWREATKAAVERFTSTNSESVPCHMNHVNQVRSSDGRLVCRDCAKTW